MNKLQSIISQQASDFVPTHSLSFNQVKAVNAISACRTAAMGSHTLACDCGHSKVVHNSCSNRHCPNCGTFSKEFWVNKQQASLLPTHYFHLVFTVPDSLRMLIYFNQNLLFNLLYQATSKTILDLSDSQFNVTPGFSLILHTWSQTLMFHPHLHCILTGGGLSKDHTYFKSFKKKFFLPIKMLSAVFKAKFLEGLKKLYHQDLLKYPYDLKLLTNPSDFQSFIDDLYAKDWVVFSKPVFKCADHVLKYLGRYTHRVAISNYRIQSFSHDHVSFSYHDNNDGGKQKVMTLSSDEFMRRFLMHVLPHQFVKIIRSQNVTLCRQLISKQRGIVLPLITALDRLDILLKLIDKEKLCCPICGRFYVYHHEVNLN